VLFCLLVRPEAIACGADLCFCCRCFYPFHREISEMRQPMGVKFCTVITSKLNFIMLVQNFGGPHQKNLRSQNMQNLARFRTTSNFSGEYLRNGWRFSKSDKYILYNDSSRVGRKKFSEH